jgi:hypothetical protein
LGRQVPYTSIKEDLMTSQNRVFGVLLLGFGLLVGCIDDSSSDSTPDVPEDLPGENVSRPASATGATEQPAALQLQPPKPLCGTCDPAEQCCNINSQGCFVVSPDGQRCV